MFGKVQRVRTLVRFMREQAPQYGPLLRQDLHEFRDELFKATAGAVIAAVSSLLFACFLSVALIISAWEGGHRTAVAWLICGGWAALAVLGVLYARKVTTGPAPFRLMAAALNRDRDGLVALIDV